MRMTHLNTWTPWLWIEDYMLLIEPDRVHLVNCSVRIVIDDIYVLAVGRGDASL